MAIDRIEIKDFLVFKDVFDMDFCSGVNVIIGGNATGKTTLLKCLYGSTDTIAYKTSRYFDAYDIIGGKDDAYIARLYMPYELAKDLKENDKMPPITEYLKLENNHLEAASRDLFTAVVNDGFGIWEDEDE